MKSKLKKTLISSIPYVFIALFATKLGQTWRLADGITVSEKFLHIADGFTEAMQSHLPSFHPLDLLVGVMVALIIRLIVYEKSKNAKKYLENTPIIRGINGMELVELVLKYYGQLSEKYQKMIPLKMVYIPVTREPEE